MKNNEWGTKATNAIYYMMSNLSFQELNKDLLRDKAALEVCLEVKARASLASALVRPLPVPLWSNPNS
jgi:hypothetical protein